MEQKRKAIFAVAVFLCACLLPSLGMAFLPMQADAANQTLAPFPALHTANGEWNESFFRELIDYASDHFAFRQELITLNAEMNAALFGLSAEDSVVLGKDGWLFYRETLPDYLHTQAMSERQLYGTARTLALLTEYAGSRGATLAFTVAPNKASLYPDKLPDVGKPLDGRSDAERLIPFLEREGVVYIDLFSAFRTQEEPLYYRTDSHWNERGAALARDTLLTGLGRETAPQFLSPWRIDGTHRGDLYEMLYPAGRETEPLLAPENGFTFSYAHPIHSAEDRRIETARPDRTGRLLMFRDSFGNSLHRYMADEWEYALFSRAMPWQMDLLDEAQADTVVLEIVERNLDTLSRCAPVFPAPRRYLSGEPAKGAAAAVLHISEQGAPAGCVRLEGELFGAVDVDSPIYLMLGDALYEATPAGETGDMPFTLYVPREEAVKDAMLLYLHHGILCHTAHGELSDLMPYEE